MDKREKLAKELVKVAKSILSEDKIEEVENIRKLQLELANLLDNAKAKVNKINSEIDKNTEKLQKKMKDKTVLSKQVALDIIKNKINTGNLSSKFLSDIKWGAGISLYPMKYTPIKSKWVLVEDTEF